MYSTIRNITALVILLGLSIAAKAGGFIIVMPDQHQNPNQQPLPVGTLNPALFPLEMQSTHIETDIFEQTATTSIDQVFYNPTQQQLEGYFLFPVPKDVVINKFTMFINGKETEAELLDATKARSIYEEIVRRSQDPALLEYYDNGMFRVRIFPIMPQSEQRIRLTYSETLQKDNGTVTYEFPLNTQKYSAKPVKDLSVKVNLEANSDIKNVYCPTHEVELIRKSDKHSVIGFEAQEIRNDRDFALYFNLDDQDIGMSMLNYQSGKEDGYFFMNLSPGLAEKQEVVAKDIVFVVDKSGSMAGEKMDQAKKALSFCVENLNEGDRFEIIPFSTEASSLFGKVEPFDKDTRQEARDFIEDIRPIGGTNIDEALEMALASQTTKQTDRPFFVIFMTDGRPTIGETGEDALLAKVKEHNKENVRIFTFGIGTDINTHLLDKITEETRAYRTYVLPDEDIEVKVSDFYTKASSPVLTDIKVEFSKNVRVSEVYPKQLPDMFKGSSMSLMGRFKGEGQGTVTVTGMVNGKERKFEYEVDFEKKKTQHEFIPDLWASRAVGYLLDQIRLHGESEELVEEVVRLAKKHGIITPYTSYLIIEDEANWAQTNPEPMREEVLRPRAMNAPTVMDDVAEEAEIVNGGGRAAKTGKRSVEMSQENQMMGNASNLAARDIAQNKDMLSYEDDLGNTQNLAGDIVNVQGRALYLNNNQWVDANLALSDNSTMNTNRIAFGSKDYFKLLEDPEAAELMALGRNVRFMLNNEIYEIYEKG